MTEAGPVQAELAAAEEWFERHGLPYFVPAERAAVRRALRPGRTLPLLVGVIVIAVGAGVALAWFADEITAGPAMLLLVVLVAAVWYALTALRFRPILTWGLSRTFGSLTRLLPMMSRALPLLLVFVTFLFINAEVWQMTASLTPGLLWLTVLLFTAVGVVFLLVRIPDEVDRTDDDVDADFLRRSCVGTPLEAPCRRLLADGSDPASYAEVSGFERWNLILVLLVVQAVQVLLLAVGVFGFFLVFGSLTMDEHVQLSWTGLEGLRNVPWLPSVSLELVQVSVFLAGFSGLYLTVSTVTDETYRAEFFSEVTRAMDRAVGMRAVYLALRHDDPSQPGDPAESL